jgi:hypothetical protein
MLSMTTLLASRAASQGLVREFLAFLRTLIVADSQAGDDSSTRFCWPRGL